jgi:hypothetical protein
LVWFLSFQKFAICTRERYAAAAFATPAQMSNFVVARLGIMTSAVDVRKLSSSVTVPLVCVDLVLCSLCAAVFDHSAAFWSRFLLSGSPGVMRILGS